MHPMARDSPTVIAQHVQASRYIDIAALVVCGRSISTFVVNN